jgi:hypothetical protein
VRRHFVGGPLRAPSARCARFKRAFAIALCALGGAACEGQGNAGDGLVVERKPIARSCTPLAGTFPSGLALLSQASHRAALVQTSPPGVASFDVEAERPIALAFHNIGTDSDSDGQDDATAITPYVGFPLSPVMGEITALRDDLAFVSTSNYEQVLVYDPSDAAPRGVLVETPASTAPGAYPLLPPPGETHLRTGISTLACIRPSVPFDSTGEPTAPSAVCDPDQPSYLTTLTAGKAVAGGRLFVATSNLASGSRFHPGTVLVYQWIESGGALRVRPDAATPLLFTEHFNPTGVTRVMTPGGRELVLVTATGAIGSGTGTANVLTDGAIEVIDPIVPRIAAVIPLGLAGASFDAPALDPGGRMAWVGASSFRQVYAVDLRALDDARLYTAGGPPATLDGLDAGFPDARVFHASEPLALPNRANGPPPALCLGYTQVAVNAAGSELFATDFCDGTFTRARIDLSGTPPVPVPRDRFQIAAQQRPFAPSTAVGELRSPGILRVRPGAPGVDYRTPDVLVIAGQPDAQLCALRVESQ